MSDDPRESEHHAMFSSLKAAHTAHRVASEIHGLPTEALRPILHSYEATHLPIPLVEKAEDRLSIADSSHLITLPDWLSTSHGAGDERPFRLSAPTRFVIAIVLLSILLSVLVVVVVSSIPAFVRGPQQTTKQVK